MLSVDWLAQRALIQPRKLALVAEEGRFSYAELSTAADVMVWRLLRAGLEPGRRVALLLSNSASHVCLIHAAARLGATLVPLNVRLTPRELQPQVARSRPDFLLCDATTEATAAALLSADLRVLPLSALEQLADAPPPSWSPRPFDARGVQSVVHTSGTTGQPKGVLLTFDNHFWSATASVLRLGHRPQDRWLACMPLYHVGGMAIVLRCCLYGTTVVLQRTFDPDALCHAVEAERVSLVSVVPTMLHRALELWERRPAPASLRCVLLGGAAASQQLLEHTLALRLPLATTYGLTEAASQVATSHPEGVLHKPGSVGKPLMFTQLRVADERGQTLAAGDIGEIRVKGPTVMRGYDGEAGLKDGELHTGDLGFLDDEDDLWPVQRRADLILSGGEKVIPFEVERALLEHPEVEQACVVGLDDAVWGQRVAAAVVRKPGARTTEVALSTFCEDKLAGFKRPRVVHFVERLPQTSAGKLDRSAVAQQLSQTP